MNELIVDLHISADEYQRLYRGEVASVLARARDGRRVRFPATALRPFVTWQGVKGSFRIVYGSNGKLAGISRV